jgi:hypothetical protein
LAQHEGGLWLAKRRGIAAAATPIYEGEGLDVDQAEGVMKGGSTAGS